MKKFALCLALTAMLLFVISPDSAYAETNRRNILKGSADYSAILYNSSNGLPTSEANTIVESADGFIWIGGYSGLVRYDGTNFFRYPSSVGISSVVSLYSDSKGRLWVGTNDNGVALYENEQFTIYSKSENLRSASIRAITEDPEGNILIATTQGLSYIDTDLNIHLLDDSQINNEYIWDLQLASNNTIYGLTNNGTIFEINSLRVSSVYPLEQITGVGATCIYSDPDDPSHLYVGTGEAKIFLADVSSATILDTFDAPGVSQINAFLKKDGFIWVCTDSGIGYLDENNKFAVLSDVALSNSVDSIMEDHEGNLWFTSTRQGVLKVVPDRFSDISNMGGLEQMVVNSTCLVKDQLYIGADNGLTILTDKSYDPVENELTEMLTDVRIRSIKKDSQDRLWFCTFSDYGLVRYDPATEEIKTFNEETGIDTTRIRTCLECNDGSMAVATSNGLYLIRNDVLYAHYNQSNGIANMEILSLAQGEDDKLYLGSDGGGIYVVENQRVQKIGLEDGLTSEVILRIKWDESRKLFWIITSNAIQYLKDGTITAVTNFPYSNNFDIYFDDAGNAWILSSNGIYVTTVDALLKNEGIEYTFYDTKSGLPYITTANSRSELDDSGRLFISGSTGVCAVNINAKDVSASNVKLAIPSVEINDEIVAMPENNVLDIPSDSKRLVINAYALTYGLSNPRIQYYLEGFEDSPIEITKQEMQPVVYTNLDGGSYTFHLCTIDDQTGKIDQEISVRINKELALHEMAIFQVLLILGASLLIGLVLFFIFRNKQKTLQKKQEEAENFNHQIIRTFAKCIDARDSQNKGHSFRVAKYTKLLAEKLAEKRGYTKEQINNFYYIALLHDIGKLSIPDAILNKPKGLSDEEYEIMKGHAAEGEKILADVDIVQDLAVGAGCHHERMDGRGYPKGLKGDEIPEVARIIAVADTFDAMYSTRPYRKQMPLDEVAAEIDRVRGTQFEDEIVDAFDALVKEGRIGKKEEQAS